MDEWMRLQESIFTDAIELAPDRRAGFLDRACEGNATLRKCVDDLLAAHAAAGAFLVKSTAKSDRDPAN